MLHSESFPYQQARKTFVVMRKDMMETKSDLEATVKLHRESVQKTRVVEAEIEVYTPDLSVSLLAFLPSLSCHGNPPLSLSVNF